MLNQEDYNKLENYHPSNNRRKDEIKNFLKYHPGCTKEEVFLGVKNIASKNTVQKILDELEKEETITIKKYKPNSRGYKLFLNEGNILIVFNEQISDFNNEFDKLIQAIESITPQLVLLPFNNKENIENNFRMILVYERLPLFILKYLNQCIFLKSILVWPKIIQKEEIRNKLTSLAFNKISKLISTYSNFYNKKLSENNSRQFNYNPNLPEELVKSENNILFFASFLDRCKTLGIDKEFESVVDKIWLINSDVQEYLHPEARLFDLDYEYGKDNWRKYLFSYEQNIVRIRELENSKKDKAENLMSNLNIRDFF
jgi:hypothetical protein